ncbi:LPXTG cell wall anchor domain-containing protein [Butyricicoccus sp. 1XD8-22]|nr:LPXTG cell wall anchor domain-containing protein [Butyricicoccus sp. 1XD8-22]
MNTTDGNEEQQDGLKLPNTATNNHSNLLLGALLTLLGGSLHVFSKRKKQEA